MPLKEIKKLCCQFEWWNRDLILLKINLVRQWVNGVALVDLRRALDLVDHDIFYYNYILPECRCSERSLYTLNPDTEQFVSIQNKKSGVWNVSVGVPQGSILGPHLLTILINNLPRAANKASVYMYADDIYDNLRKCCIQARDWSPTNVLKVVSDWTVKNKLLMNSKKTKLMIGTKHSSRDVAKLV